MKQSANFISYIICPKHPIWTLVERIRRRYHSLVSLTKLTGIIREISDPSKLVPKTDQSMLPQMSPIPSASAPDLVNLVLDRAPLTTLLYNGSLNSALQLQPRCENEDTSTASSGSTSSPQYFLSSCYSAHSQCLSQVFGNPLYLAGDLQY